jgi:hypothetical protein
MTKDIDNVIRKKLKRREELQREIRQIDVELEALQAAADNIGAMATVRRNFAEIQKSR